MSKERVRYYESYDDDFYQVGKEYKLDDDYEYINKKMLFRAFSAAVCFIAFIISSLWCRLFLRVRFVGAEKLRREKGAFFLYGNHTQPIGDVFNPALACFPKRIYTVVSVANMHLPIIGRLLKPLGALPLPNTVTGLKKFTAAVRERYSQGCPIVIYPEAHLWEYYTDIRPFGDAAFRYPASLDAKVYTATATYRKPRWGSKPRMTVYIDGPFTSEEEGIRARSADLCNKCTKKMKERSQSSTCKYIKYVKK